MIEISLLEKRALITGAASGIGRATAKLFYNSGADLILVDQNIYELNETKKEIDSSKKNNYKDNSKAKDSKVEIYTVDLSKKEKIDKLWDKIDETGKIPDILVNNAGIYPFQDYLKMDEKSLEHIMDVNLNSMFWMCQNFIKRKKRDGIIVNISSIEAIMPFKEDTIPYSISKAGVISLTRSITRDYGRRGFRANVILPGAIRTEGTNSLIKKTIQTLDFKLVNVGYLFNKRLAMGRWGKPEEVAKVILFLSSDLASYVQGAMLPVDGGFLSS
ncbi:MAG: SDR family NAD(P)-dependent oxidoreductase [Candidatus Pacearchaeota archaeon]|nr:SDR family NAD(P)-dependent oxidoreductase [Candidatus Pacearchaeota archaeon]